MAASTSHSSLPDTPGQPIMLWRVSKPGLPSMKLFGVLHFATADMYPLPAEVAEAYAAADLMAFESDLQQMATPAFAAILQERGTLPAGESLPQSLSDNTWERLQNKAWQLGWNPEQLASLTVWHCASLLTAAALRHSGLSATLGLDSYLFQQTLVDGKEILCLESPEQQLEMLALTQTGSDETMVLELLEELDAVPELSQQLLTMWKNGDAAELSRILQQNFSSLPQQREWLLYQRNRAWLEQLLPLQRQGRKIMAAVGAGHLVGPQSLPAMCQEQGFQVKQLQK